MSRHNRFQSEYDRHYQWLPNRSNVYDISEGSPFAGKQSVKMYTAHEPPLQHKKRVQSSCAVDHLQNYSWEGSRNGSHMEDDFMLLGENEKFASNVPYRNSAKLMRPRTAPAQDRNKTYPMKENRDWMANKSINVPTPDTPRIEKRLVRPASAHPRRRAARNPSPDSDEYRPRRRRSADYKKCDDAVQTDTSYTLEKAIRHAAKLDRPRSPKHTQNAGRLNNWNVNGIDANKRDGFYRSIDKPSRQSRLLNGQHHNDKKAFNGTYKTKQTQHNDRHEARLRSKSAGVQRQRSYSPQNKSFVKSTNFKSQDTRKQYDNDLDKEISNLKRRREGHHHQDDDDTENYAKKYNLGVAPHRPKPFERHSEYQRQYSWKRPIGGDQTQWVQDNDLIHRSHLTPAKRYRYPMATSEYRRQYAPNRNRSLSPELGGYKQHIAHNQDRYISPPPRRALTPPPRVEMPDRDYTSATILNPQRMSFPLGPQRRHLSEYSAKFRNFYGDDTHQNAKKELHRKRDDHLATPAWFQQVAELRRQVEEYRLRARGTHFSREHMAQLLSKANKSWDPPPSSSVEVAPVENGLKKSRSWNKWTGVPKGNSPLKLQLESDSREETDLDNGRVATPLAERSFVRHHLDKTTPAGVIAPSAAWRASSEVPRPRTAPAHRKPRLDQLSPAGKPSFDPYYILDEEASHDTPIKSKSKSPSPYPTKPYQLGDYANNGYSEVQNGVPLKDHRRPQEEVLAGSHHGSSISTSMRSLASSASLAADTLDRARRRRDDLMY